MSIVQMSANPSSPRESKAITRPSGDHDGEPCQIPGPRVSWTGWEPSALASQISWTSPERPDSKANRRPSGEKLGPWSRFEEAATIASGRPVSKEKTSTSRRVWAKARRSRPPTIAGDSPSGGFDPLGGSGSVDPHPPEMREPHPRRAVYEGRPALGPGEAEDREVGSRHAARRRSRRSVGAQLDDVDVAGRVRVWQGARCIGQTAAVGREGRVPVDAWFRD